MSLDIRPAIDADRPAIAALHTASWQDAYRGDLPDDFLDNELPDRFCKCWQEAEITAQDVVLVAESNDEPVGFVAIWCQPDPYIDNLHVDPAARSGGIGRRLMQEAARELLRRGHTSTYLWVLESNRAGIRFYERLSGKRTEKTNRPLFGHERPAYKIEWSDLSVILAL